MLIKIKNSYIYLYLLKYHISIKDDYYTLSLQPTKGNNSYSLGL